MEVTSDAEQADQGASCDEQTCSCCPMMNWKVIVPVALLAVVVFGGFYIYQELIGSQKASEPYRMALELVKKDPQVIERLGEPVNDTWRVGGEVFSQGDRGEANLNFPVTGPRGEAAVRAQARRSGGKWGLTLLEVTFDDGQRVSLQTQADEGLEDAPAWSP